MPQDMLQARVLEHLSLRIGPETAAYLARHLRRPADSLSLMGGDARTGTPRRLLLTAGQLAQLAMLQSPPLLQ